MDTVQVIAYPAFGRLSILCTTARTDETGRSWTQRLQTMVDLPDGGEDPWESILVLGRALIAAACEHDRQEPPWDVRF